MTQPTPAPDWQDTGKRDLLHDRRALGMIGAGVVAVAALGYFVVLPMLSGGSSSSAADVVPHGHPKVTASASPSAAAPAAVTTVAPALNVRDPFNPLYVAPTAAAVAAPAVPVAAVPVAAAPVAAPPQTQTIVVAQPGPTVTKTAAPKYTLQLQQATYKSDPATKQSTQSVVVLLNGQRLTENAGQNFPDPKNGQFRLMSVSSDLVAQFAYGEQTFAMNVGETQTEN